MNEQTQALARQLLDGQPWTSEQARVFFTSVVRGETDRTVLEAVITGLNERGPTAGELTGAARALLESATPFPRPEYEFADIVGTGGDGHNTINLSTLAAITAAACGYSVIKHGNRSITSYSGSFDLLQALGVDPDLQPQASRHQVDRYGICFLFAPRYHPGMRHAADVRRALKVRTIFNLLGPLVNPARPGRMLLGVADAGLLEPVAGALQALGCASGAVVCGSGVDEVAIHGPTSVIEIGGPEPVRYEVVPGDFGSRVWSLNELICHDAATSHQRSARILGGAGSAAENAAVCINVALLMKQFGEANLADNFAGALQVLRSGKPAELMAQLAGGPSRS